MHRFPALLAPLLGLPLVLASSLARAETAPDRGELPIVVNTWAGPFSEATAAAWQTLEAGGTALDAVEQAGHGLAFMGL